MHIVEPTLPVSGMSKFWTWCLYLLYMYPSQWNVLLHSSIHFQSKLQQSAALAANWNTGPICCQCTCLCGQSPLRRRPCQRTCRCACQTDDFIVQFARSTQVQQQFLQQSVTIWSLKKVDIDCSGFRVTATLQFDRDVWDHRTVSCMAL